jgi:hypothetical protein
MDSWGVNSANWHLQLFKYIIFISIIIQEEIEESKEVIRISKLKERQRNTSREGTVYPSRTPEFTPDFSGFVLLNLLFYVYCFVDRCLSFCPYFFWALRCLSFNLLILITSKQIVSIIHVSLQWSVVWFQTTIWFYKYVYMYTVTVYLVLLLYFIKIITGVQMFVSRYAKCLCQDMPNVYINMCQMIVLRYAKCLCQHVPNVCVKICQMFMSRCAKWV